jgi:hypothetical protein
MHKYRQTEKANLLSPQQNRSARAHEISPAVRKKQKYTQDGVDQRGEVTDLKLEGGGLAYVGSSHDIVLRWAQGLLH